MVLCMDIEKLNNFFNKNIKSISYYSLLVWCLFPILFSILMLFLKRNSLIIFITCTVVLLLGVLGILLIISKTSKEKHISKTFKIELILLIWALITSLLSSNKLTALYGNYNLHIGFFSILSFLAITFLSNQIKDKKKYYNLFKIIIFSITITSILSIIKNPYHSVSYFNQFNHYSYLLLIGLVLNTVIYNKVNNKWIYVITYSINLYTLILNNTFGSFLSYLVIFVVYIIYNIINKRKIPYILIIIFIVVSIFLRPIVFNNFNSLGNDINIIVNDQEKINNVGTLRGKLWIKGIELVGEKPIFGYGLDNYHDAYISKDCIHNQNPHNILLFSALGLGIPGLIILLTLLCYIYIPKLKKIKKLKEIEEVGIFVTLGFLISSMLGNPTIYVSPYFYIFLGLMVSFFKEDKDEKYI